MTDEPNPTSATPTGTQPLGNAEGTRNPDGSLKDNQSLVTDTKTPTEPEPKPEAKPEAKPEGDKKADAKPAGAPEAYTDFKAPDGFEIDKATLDKFTPLFKEMNLSQEQAQKLVDEYAAVSKDASEAPYKQFEALRQEWRDKVIKDPALGDGKADLKPEVRAVIGRAIDSLPADQAKDFREALVLTGAGDNPAFVKAFYTLASQLGEGTLVKGGGPSPGGQRAPNAGPRSAASALYPNLPSSSSQQ